MDERSRIEPGMSPADIFAMLDAKHPKKRVPGVGVTVAEYAKHAGISCNTARTRLEGDPEMYYEDMMEGKCALRVYFHR